MKKLSVGIVSALCLSGVLVACGGDADSNAASGQLTLRITDAPIDGAEHVYIQFRGVELHGPGGEMVAYHYCQGEDADAVVTSATPCAAAAPRRLDLLALTAGASDVLLDGIVLPAGHYPWARLLVDTDAARDSYIVLAGGAEHELAIPSSAQTGLKLNRGFDVAAGGAVDFTIDFDLRKSVHLPLSGSDYVLRPTLRVVDSLQVGHIAGQVDASLVSGNGCAVYVFAGADVTPDDIDGNAPDPVTSAGVTYDAATGRYAYKAAFLEPGAYTLALTCEVVNDDPARDDAIAFGYVTNVNVNAQAVANGDLPAAISR